MIMGILFMLFRLQSHRGNISILWWRKNYILSGHAHNFQGLEKHQVVQSKKTQNSQPLWLAVHVPNGHSVQYVLP